MSALTEFLFPAPAPRSARAILAWWEKRRLGYNAIVGGAGVLSLTMSVLINALPPNGFIGPVPWIAVAVFGVLANVCYLLGPVAELTIEKIWKGRVLPTGPVLYRMGLTFSVGLALFPTLLVSMVWVYRVVAAVL